MPCGGSARATEYNSEADINWRRDDAGIIYPASLSCVAATLVDRSLGFQPVAIYLAGLAPYCGSRIIPSNNPLEQNRAGNAVAQKANNSNPAACAAPRPHSQRLQAQFDSAAAVTCKAGPARLTMLVPPPKLPASTQPDPGTKNGCSGVQASVSILLVLLSASETVTTAGASRLTLAVT